MSDYLADHLKFLDTYHSDPAVAATGSTIFNTLSVIVYSVMFWFRNKFIHPKSPFLIPSSTPPASPEPLAPNLSDRYLWMNSLIWLMSGILLTPND